MKRRRRIGAVGLGRDTEGLRKCSHPRYINLGRDRTTAWLTLSSRTSRAEHARERTESTRGKTPASRRSTAPTRPESKRFWSAPATARAVADVRGRLDYSTAVKLREHPFGSQDRIRGKEARVRLRAKLASSASRSAAAAPASSHSRSPIHAAMPHARVQYSPPATPSWGLLSGGSKATP